MIELFGLIERPKSIKIACKDISYWHNIQTVGADGILDIKRASLDFLM